MLRTVDEFRQPCFGNTKIFWLVGVLVVGLIPGPTVAATRVVNSSAWYVTCDGATDDRAALPRLLNLV